MKTTVIACLIGLGFVILIWLSYPLTPAAAATVAPTHTPGMSFQLMFTPPPTVYPPTQADAGAQTYFYVCLVCHGDKGQGLTAWRQELTPPDNNCWQSKCHSPNHMDFGFTFPRDVPALKNPAMLLTFQNALNLHDFIKRSMPYQYPGSLTDEQYWQLTAFLLKMNGINPGSQPLNFANAASVSLVTTASRPPAVETPSDPVLIIAGVVLFVCACLFAAVLFLRRR